MSVGGIKKKISGMGGVRIPAQGGDAGRKGVGRTGSHTSTLHRAAACLTSLQPRAWGGRGGTGLPSPSPLSRGGTEEIAASTRVLVAGQGSLGGQASPAGLLPTQPRAAWSDLTSHGWVFFFFPQRHVYFQNHLA